MDRKEGVAELRALLEKLRDELSGFAETRSLNPNGYAEFVGLSDRANELCELFDLPELFRCETGPISQSALITDGKNTGIPKEILRIDLRVSAAARNTIFLPFEAAGLNLEAAKDYDIHVRKLLDSLLRWFESKKASFLTGKMKTTSHINDDKLLDLIQRLRARLMLINEPLATQEQWEELIRGLEEIRLRGIRDWGKSCLLVMTGAARQLKEVDNFLTIHYEWVDPFDCGEKLSGALTLPRLLTPRTRKSIMNLISWIIGWLGRLERFALFHEGEKNPKKAAEVKAGSGVGEPRGTGRKNEGGRRRRRKAGEQKLTSQGLKLVSALCTWHDIKGYGKDVQFNKEKPAIGCREVEKEFGIPVATVSEQFKELFGSYKEYSQRWARNPVGLAYRLATLNGEVFCLRAANPVSEDDSES